MSLRSSLASSAAFIPSGLIDEAGAPIPSTRKFLDVDVRTLPLIEADALPPLPPGVEARPCQDPEGNNHLIVLWSPVHQVSVDFPLAHHVEDRSAIVRAAEAMIAAFPTRRAA